MKKILTIIALFAAMTTTQAKKQTVQINILETTDVHGCFFPWDFINKRPMKGTFARTATFLKQARQANPDGVILLENGDILQGQPINYYYNYIASNKQNIASQTVNYLGFDAQNWGNHDVETAHPCFDKWDSELNCPVLGANVIDKSTGKPYLKPYVMFERKGIRIAVIGMLTEAIPNWLTEDIYAGLEFEDLEISVRKWLKIVKETERPDIIIGLFHSGLNGGIITEQFEENCSERIAQQVPGFDAILFGHDHQVANTKVKCVDGKEVLIINPANQAQNIAEVVLTVTKKGKKIVSKNIEGKIHNIRDIDIDADYMQHFESEINEVKQWADRKIGVNNNEITTRDCFFGSSAFTDLIHNLQLQLTNADISFSAPLTFNATLKKGDITVADMFKLYKFENKLFVMNLTGEEIRKALEMSYDLWVNTMQTPDDHIMLLANKENGNERNGFKNMTFNFDSAAGIDYVVDVTKPDGEKVRILQMSNGQPFDEKKTYKVAVNSYRGNGGGELLTKGAGIPQNELDSRIISRTDRDQRWYLMKEIERLGSITPKANNNWRFVPEEWTIPALKRDRALIFKE